MQAPADVGGFGIGVQVCSDANRPQGCNSLAAMGADAILIPRATPAETYPRWRLVLRANAVTSCAYVVSVNRPGTRSQGVIGGPSMVAGPSGEVLLETRDPVATITLEKSVLARARNEYPGYLGCAGGRLRTRLAGGSGKTEIAEVPSCHSLARRKRR